MIHWTILLLGLVILAGMMLLFIQRQKRSQTQSGRPSNYELYSQDKFNQPDSYPVNQTLDPDCYRPISAWLGRLILHSTGQESQEDSVLFEVYNAPSEYQHLLGQIVKLKWTDDPTVRSYVASVTTDITLTEAARNSQKAGSVHPDRLNHRKNVGPLESLAGARPDDTVTVILQDSVQVTEKTILGTSDKHQVVTLTITEDPIQVTGRFYGLVTIIGRKTQASDRFEVCHFNKISKEFDGPQETIRIPQVLADRNGVFRSRNNDIEKSPLNETGWYIYGAKDTDGLFVVQAIEPRALMQLQPNAVILGVDAGLQYIQQVNWQETEAQKGTGKTVLIDPTAKQPEAAIADWQAGDQALVIHLFGGIGGTKNNERGFLGLVTGHFAYGVARVVRDPLTDELRFDIDYYQVYAHNPDGIISGAIKWCSYMGDLQRGWLGDRPVSDVIVKLDAVTQGYDFGGIQLSPFAEYLSHLKTMAAHYRTGNGTGAAIVSPAHSCVQDSNQALYIALQHVEDALDANPGIQGWLQNHPQHPQTLRFQQLIALGRSLKQELVPLGIVRHDWQENTERQVGTTPVATNALLTGLRALMSWQTILPRAAHDQLLGVLLRQGAKLWIIRTNQIGGNDPDILPLAPTNLFG